MDHNFDTNKNIRESITKMALGRDFEHILPPGAIKAAVFMPLVEADGKLSLLFEVRSKLIGQAGEVCFPGGRIEEGESPLDAAVRETMEELELGRKAASLLLDLIKKGSAEPNRVIQDCVLIEGSSVRKI